MRGVPTLADVVDARAGRGRLILEIKNQPGQPDFDAPREQTARTLVEFLRGHGSTGELETVTVSSFDWHAIEVIRDADIGVRTAFLTMPRMSVSAGLVYVRSAGHSELHAHVSAVLGVNGAVERARRARIRLVTWTVVSNDAALRLREADIDGVICDDPAAVVRAVNASETSASGLSEKN
jgi:glycerophosphoryl diester phosphodiesterase